ncbi:MAG: hypothetical protein AAGI51_05015 [Pseudomonadota bacterium]
MTALLRLPLLGLAALWMLAAPAAADLAKARALIELVRLDAAIARFEAEGRRGLAAQTATLPDPAAAALTGLWSTHFAAEDLMEDLGVLLAEDLPDATLDALLTLYDAPEARRITEIEAAAQQDAVAHDRDAEAAALLARMQAEDDPRLPLLARLTEATDAVDVSVTIGLNATYAMSAAMMGSPTFPQVLSDEELLAMIGGFEPRMRAEAERAIAATSAWTYRALSEAELTAYAEMIEGAAPRAFYAAVNRALETLLVDRSRRFGAAAMEATGARDI